jgi:hypothetical protein
MIQPDLMKKTVLLAVFLFINFHISIGQTKYEVVRGIYLKANPDTYADDLMLIPAGKIVKKDLSSDYPFIRITYNGEVGYVSINDLKVYSKPEEKKETNHDIIENEGDTIETDTATTPPSNVEPPKETEVVTIPWLEILWPYLYLLLIIPILFFLVFTWILIRRKSNLKAAKQAIEKATADIKEARAIVEATKLNISAVIDVFNNYSGLDSIITRVKASKVSTDNSIRNVDKLALEIKETAKVIDEVTSTKEALEVRNSAEILKSKADTANKAASDEKIAVEKEIDSCIGKLKGLTTSAANKAITDANLTKNIINNAKADISVINEIVDTGLTNANKFVSNAGTPLKAAKTKIEILKTNSDEIKLAAEKIQIKANNAIADANAALRGEASVRLAIDAKITAEKATISTAATLAEAKVIKEKSKNLRADSENIKIEVDNAIKEIKPSTPIIPEPPIGNQFKFVNYSFKGTTNTSSYPILLSPKKGCIVRSHKLIKTGRRGYKEALFQAAIESYFGNEFQILGDARLDTGRESRPFEPDIAIIDKKYNSNLRIDIEIDEPYAGISRQPTHCIGEDIFRDNYFKDRGWIVIRLSEYQVHLSEGSSLKFIAETIKAAIPNYIIPSDLSKLPSLAKDKLWDTLQAQKWEKDNYREKYLEHDFEKEETPNIFVKQEFTKQDIEEESKVENTWIGEIEKTNEDKFNGNNKHNRDKRIEFYTEPHVYTIDKVPAVSVSTIIDKFFPVFDTEYWAAYKAPSLKMTPSAVAKMWKEKGELSAKDGKILHEQIEKYFLNNEKFTSKEFGLFKDFMIRNSQINPFRTEWRIFDEEYLVAGTIDLVSKNNNEYEIYDWKRSQSIIDDDKKPKIKGFIGKHGIGDLVHISDTRYNRYCLQQSMYKFILEKNYGISIKAMYIVVLHPDYANFYKFPIPYHKKEIEYILSSLK